MPAHLDQVLTTQGSAEVAQKEEDGGSLLPELREAHFAVARPLEQCVRSPLTDRDPVHQTS
jgi:hypothetical protein